MSALVWDSVGDRRFEGGLDRGVLFGTDGTGVAWNGLTSVKEGSDGGSATPYYIDGLKYLNLPSGEDMIGTIEAFTYPDEFGIHDGTMTLSTGLIATQQRRKPFALSYRTLLGNDVDGQSRGYKLHIIYNMLAEPSDRAYATFGDTVSPMAFSWNFTTLPKKPKSSVAVAPLAHVIIDSTKTSPAVLKYVENRIYGSAKSVPMLMSLDELFQFFDNPVFMYSILADSTTGLATLQLETDGTGDLIGTDSEGLYEAPIESRLAPKATPGFYTLGT